VWMGGVTAELDSVRSAIGVGATAPNGAIIDPLVGHRIAPPDGSPHISGIDRRGEPLYERLLILMRSRLRVDVIAGTSAGGINGALLGAAVARRTRVPDVRALWIELGRFESLLRGALEPDPPSLLNGDGYLLPNLERIFERVIAGASPFVAGAAAAAPAVFNAESACPSSMRMMITGTDFSGESVTHRDDFRDEIEDIEHRALLTFVRDPFTPVSPAGGDEAGVFRSADSFAAAGAARRLARAARTSSSFPVAFEPSLCRVTPPPAGDPGQWADMRPVASFTTDRWLMDGGVLDNSPFRPVLDAFAGMPADGDVRRVLAYVVPYVSYPPTVADAAVMPTIKTVVGAVVNLPRELSLTDDLIRIEEYRRRRDGRVGARKDLREIAYDDLFDLAKLLLSPYVRQRTLASIDDLMDRLRAPSSRASESGLYVRPTDIPDPPPDVPWVPDPGMDLTAGPMDPWPWGIKSVERAVRLALEIVRDAIAGIRDPTRNWRDPDLDSSAVEALVRPLQAARGELGSLLVQVLMLDAAFLDGVARAVQAAASPPTPVILTLATDVFDGPSSGEPGAPSFRERAGSLALEATDALQSAFADQPRLRPTFLANPLPSTTDLSADAEAALRRLLAIEVVERAVAGDYEPDLPFALMRLSAHAANSFDTRVHPGEKLAGMQLQHFGGFYKSSWRANDWMWGRLDGASRIVDVVLDADRMRHLYKPGDSAVIAQYLLDAACDGLAPAEETELLQGCGHESSSEAREALTTEIDDVLAGNGDLAACGKLVRGRLQLDILREELPQLAEAIELDEKEGAARRPDSARWLQTYGDPLRNTAVPLAPSVAIEAFKGSKIADETIAGEVGSDLLSRTLSTALAVAASAITSKKSGVPGPVRALLHGLRGLMLAVYLLVRTFTQGSRIMRAIAVIVIAAAAVVVAYALYASPPKHMNITGGPPDILVAIGVVVVLAGVVAGLIRGGAFGVLTAGALLVAAIMLVLSPWPDGGVTGIYDRFREDAPTETLIVLFVTLSAFASFGGRFTWWPQRLYAWALRRLVRGPFPGASTAPRRQWLVRSIHIAHGAAVVTGGLALYATATGHDLDDGLLVASAIAAACSLVILAGGLGRPGGTGRRLGWALAHLVFAAFASMLALAAAIAAVPFPHFFTHPHVGSHATTWTANEAYVRWSVALFGLVVVAVLLYLWCAKCVAPWLRRVVPELR
jgi:patatin-related protein